jgi:hypothetical protein
VRIVRSIVLVVVTAAALLSACGDGDDTTSGTTTTSVPAAATSTTAPTSALWPALWPWADGTLRFRDPVGATRSFATTYLHMTEPIVGRFQPGDSRSGEVTVRASTTGPVTTVLVRQLGDDGSWWVLGAVTGNIRLTDPAALATITSPVELRGTSTAFEATVNVTIRQDGETAALAETFVMGGANGEIGPFAAAIDFPRPTSRGGAIVMYTTSAADGGVTEATAIRVGFGDA